MWGRGIHAFGMWWPWFGLVAGIVVLIGAVMLYVKPEQRHGWGLVILIISALNIFVGMGGLSAGTFGVIGGGWQWLRRAERLLQLKASRENNAA